MARRQAQEDIQNKVESDKKEEAEKMDQQYAEMLGAEEQKTIAEDKKKQEEIQRKDEHAF